MLPLWLVSANTVAAAASPCRAFRRVGEWREARRGDGATLEFIFHWPIAIKRSRATAQMLRFVRTRAATASTFSRN